MSNRIFLVCTHHPTQREAYLIAERHELQKEPRNNGYSNLIDDEDGYFTKWLDKHALCGGTLDHFTLSYEFTKDGDLPTPAPVANAVHLALVKANG